MIYETIFPHIKFYLIFSFLLVKILQPFLRFSNFPLLWSRAPQCHQLDYRTSYPLFVISFSNVPSTYPIMMRKVHPSTLFCQLHNQCLCEMMQQFVKTKAHFLSKAKRILPTQKMVAWIFSKSHTVMFIIIPDVSLFLIFFQACNFMTHVNRWVWREDIFTAW